MRRSLDDPILLHSLFSVRTRGLFEKNPPAALAAYLSGLLIGNEVVAASRHYGLKGVVAIAPPVVGHLYQLALSAVGATDVHWLDGNTAVAKGLWRGWQSRMIPA